ncbi:MAG: hypothetical protein RLY16_2873, partial [Bacteroidota bacterium]
DNGTPGVYNWTGNLPKCTTPVIVTLPAQTTNEGPHTFTATVSLPNGLADVDPSNDASTARFNILSTVNAPLSETFEGTQFPPTNWVVQNSDNSISWEGSTRAAYTGTRSMVINNFNNPLVASVDSFVSPRIKISSVDSAFVSFDYAYAPGPTYPGSTVFPVDTLELLISTDCGITSTSIWKKWGYQLQTVNNPNYTYTNGYLPTVKQEWRSAKISILPNLGNSDNFQVYFVSKSNKQNNLFVDNINIYGKTLPKKLKDQGYLIYPNPFNTSFMIHHHATEAPVDLQTVQLFNAAGQLVWEKHYNGTAERLINVSTSNLAKGIYVLKLVYTNKTIVERLVKN